MSRWRPLETQCVVARGGFGGCSQEHGASEQMRTRDSFSGNVALPLRREIRWSEMPITARTGMNTGRPTLPCEHWWDSCVLRHCSLSERAMHEHVTATRITPKSYSFRVAVLCRCSRLSLVLSVM